MSDKHERRRQRYNKDHGVRDSWWCHPCGHMWFRTKRRAKETARQRHAGEQLSTWRCPVTPEGWHNGHLPRSVSRGQASRDDIINYRRDVD